MVAFSAESFIFLPRDGSTVFQNIKMGWGRPPCTLYYRIEDPGRLLIFGKKYILVFLIWYRSVINFWSSLQPGLQLGIGCLLVRFGPCINFCSHKLLHGLWRQKTVLKGQLWKPGRTDLDTWSLINFGPMVQPGLLLGNGLLLIFGIFCNLVSYLVLVFYSVVKSM